MRSIIKLKISKEESTIDYNKKLFDSPREAVEKLILHLQRLLVSGDLE